MAGRWLICSQSDEFTDVTRLPSLEKQPDSDPVHKQMIYFRKEKKKPIASRCLAQEQRVRAFGRAVK